MHIVTINNEAPPHRKERIMKNLLIAPALYLGLFAIFHVMSFAVGIATTQPYSFEQDGYVVTVEAN